MVRRRDVPFPRIFWLFGAFIFACGTTHLIESMLFWWPAYRLSGLAKAATAVVSWATVFALVPIVPQALDLPGIQRMNDRLQREIAERSRFATELARQQDRLHAANQQLEARQRDIKDFLSILTHDLRHPIVSIQGLVALTRRDLLDSLSAEHRENLSLVLTECERMKGLLDQISNLARIAHTEVRHEQVRIDQWAHDLIERFRARVREKQVDVVIDVPSSAVRMPRWHVEEAMINLVDNALKYACPDGGCRLHITARVSPERLEMSVRDEGPGIEPQYHDRIFQPFRRLTADTATEGTGVGLTAVRRLIERVDGTVELTSSPGKGSTFTIRVPL